ncbi:MAG: Gfo/Idh/MocA family oxidoreductase [Opitutus sp.]|nr:Gfo/Idh/MocA family oxidoreductase [Opitutus sp.]
MNVFSRRYFLRAAAVLPLAAYAQSGPKPPRIRIGQIGTGHAHADGKMATIRGSADFELVGVVEADPRQRARAERGQPYAGVPWMTEEQLLNAPGLKVVAVETEVKDLLPVAARCVAAGKHVHLDKAPGESLPALKRLLDDAKRRKLTVQMGYMFRYNPAFQLCHQLVREGALGEVFEIDTVMSKQLDAAARALLRPYHGGSMFELGCHVIDSVVTVLGRPQKVTAHNRSVAADGFADNQLAVLEYPKATVTVRSALTEVDGGVRRQFVVCGTKGTFDIRPLEPPSARLTLDTARGEWKRGYQDVIFPKPAGRYDGDFADLARVIRGEKALAFTPEHDLAVQETVLLASGMPLG